MINMINIVPKRETKIITKNWLLLLDGGLGIAFGQAFKPGALPHKPLLFYSAAIGAFWKIGMSGMGPSNSL
jgi:hypothetical protein